MSGLLEAVDGDAYHGKADLPELAATLQLEADELFPLAETLQMLRLAEVARGDIRITAAGHEFVAADTDARKRIFARNLLAYVALAAHIRRVLDERANHSAPKSRFLDELEDYMTPDAADQTLRAVISWGRYGEIYAYDDDSGVFSLENPV
jgi:NitT/TauT family transport system ATP-binding protein